MNFLDALKHARESGDAVRPQRWKKDLTLKRYAVRWNGMTHAGGTWVFHDLEDPETFHVATLPSLEDALDEWEPLKRSSISA